MNRDSDEQRAVSQTLCGALQKEANCKCLVLSVLIYGCLAAVTWCRCANVTKVVINFDNYPLKRTEHVSPCDEGYIYIPVAFMGMLYLVYLVECYHSPIRIDLLHADSQDNVMTKLSQLKLAQPTIWWKAVSYHYVRRKRQITRYRNGDNYTTTQVYYERANTHAATSFYFYDYCGVKDISKDLTADTKLPITKITLTKGFAFSNMRSATEFEEARSRFFAEQELRDDYMEMREGLDLGYNFNPTTVVGILGNPWFTNSYVYWCLSALLLSWPLRIIIEYNTQYADYQVTKLFGVNYDTPTSGDPIHASSSQLSAPGSYMLAPSYSEALLMEPSPIVTNSQPIDDQSSTEVRSSSSDRSNGDIVPSYSEALLYERAQQQPSSSSSNDQASTTIDIDRSLPCDCFCHVSYREQNNDSTTTIRENPTYEIANSSISSREINANDFYRSCARCQSDYENYVIPGTRSIFQNGREIRRITMENSLSQSCLVSRGKNRYCHMTRDLSTPNFSTSNDFFNPTNTQFLRLKGASLENIQENDETAAETSNEIGREIGKRSIGCGTIPKNRIASHSRDSATTSVAGYRLIENPMIDDDRGTERSDDDEIERNMSGSKTYFCLKSILKQHRRRYTLVSAEELQKLTTNELTDHDENRSIDKTRYSRDNRRTHQLFNRDHFFGRNKDFTDPKIQQVSSSRSLIFPSPIEEACRTLPNDPFGGKAVHVLPSSGKNFAKPPDYEEALGLPTFTRLARSLTSIQHRSSSIDSSQRGRTNRSRTNTDRHRHHRRNLSIEPEYLLQASHWSATAPDNEKSVCNDHVEICESSIEAQGSSSCDNSIGTIQLRHGLTRGFSLNDSHHGKIERSRRKRNVLRSSLAETIGSSSSFCFDDDRDNLSGSKRFNVSMETSL